MGTVVTSFGRWGSNLISSSTEESTPDYDLSDSGGATPSASLTMIGEESDLLGASDVTPWNDARAAASMTLSDESLLSISLEGDERYFNQQVSVPPVYGTPADYMRAIQKACGLPEDSVGFSGSIRWWPGYVGDAWTLIKQMYGLYRQVTPRWSSGVLPPPYNPAYLPLESTSSSVESANGSQDITVHYYERLNTNELYPASWDYMDQSIFTVQAGEAIEEEIQLSAWAASVQQPVAVDWVPAEPATSSIYSVVGADNLPVKASQWVANGGSITVEITDDPSVLKVRIVAPDTPSVQGTDGNDRFAPYQIAMTTTEGGFYNSLHIVGTGYPYEKKFVNVRTGTEIGVENTEIDSVVVATQEQAYDVANRAIRNNDGLTRKLSGTTQVNINPGDRFRYAGGWFRVLDVTSSPEGFDFNAVQDTRVSDFQDHYSGLTYQDFQDLWYNGTYKQFKIHALREVI